MDTLPDHYSWIPVYEKIADALLAYSDKRKELIDKLITTFQSRKLKVPTWAPKEQGIPHDIDPFTVIAAFSRWMRNETNTQYLEAIGQVLGVSIPENIQYAGVPRLQPLNAAFYDWDAQDNPLSEDIPNLWKLFAAGIALADKPSEEQEERFIFLFNQVIKQPRIKWNITIGLYWMRPHYFINLDSLNREYIASAEETAFLREILPSLKKVPEGRDYLTICHICRENASKDNLSWKTLPEISRSAWDYYASPKPTKQKIVDITLPTHPTIPEPIPSVPCAYTKADFLKEVFITEAEYDRMASALEYKNNIILRGAPGVGKSFAAKRLAFSLMNEKAEKRICMVQFHHSYAYEDFLEGYRPTENGRLELKHGSFFEFCALAKADPQHSYFYIIDEINRGELNKIFGEALLLLEKDKRGENVTLLYSRESFTIPANLRIIGMMNTADRSIAMMDHALHRRFAFIDMQPAFAHEGFREFVSKSPATHLSQFLAVLTQLNEHIAEDESLGKGFRIGHSYFCPADIEALSDERLSLILEFEILPLLEEYWFEEPQKLQEWTDKLRKALQ